MASRVMETLTKLVTAIERRRRSSSNSTDSAPAQVRGPLSARRGSDSTVGGALSDRPSTGPISPAPPTDATDGQRRPLFRGTAVTDSNVTSVNVVTEGQTRRRIGASELSAAEVSTHYYPMFQHFAHLKCLHLCQPKKVYLIPCVTFLLFI